MKFLIILIVSFNLFALNVNIEKFKTCFALFTGERVNIDHSLFKQVINNSKSGVNACMELLTKANFNSNNTIRQNNSGEYDSEASRIIREFNFLHRSFFEIPSFTDLSEVVAIGDAPDVFDENVPAYYWTYNLFKSNIPLSEIVKANYSFRAIRYSTISSTRRLRRAQTGTELTIEEGWNPPLVQTGTLVGIKKDTLTFSNSKLIYGSTQFQGQNANEHFGGGVIGSNVYILSNAGRYGYRERSTGGLKVYRRWSKHVLSDLLCRGAPSLRITDVESEVEVDSSFPFRRSASCMQCHSSMDPLAGNLRNIQTVGHSTPARPFIAFKFPVTEPARENSFLPSVDEDKDFYKRPPHGRIKFRSYDGELIEKVTNSLQDLGEFISNSKDFYACTAKKYYKFLTGIEANLTDLGDPTSPQLNSTEKFHREKVIELGEKLKDHQNLQKLIKEIISLEVFIYPTKRY